MREKKKGPLSPSGNTAPKMILIRVRGSRRCYFIFISIFCVSCIGDSMGWQSARCSSP